MLIILIIHGKIWSAVLSLAFLFVLSASFYIGGSFAYIVCIPLTLGLIASKIEYMDLLSSLAIIFSFLSVPTLCDSYRKLWQNEKFKIREQLLDLEAQKSKVSKDFEESRNKNIGLEKRLSEIAELYEAMKKLSATLEFDRLLEILSQVLRDNFTFHNCVLILLNEDDSSVVDRVYHIERDQTVVRESKDTEKRFARELRDKRASIFIDFEVSSSKRIEMGLSDTTKTLAYAPLIVDDSPIGILLIEDMDKDDFSNFSILMSQFGMVVRKIKLYERVQELAIRDGLTGVFARRHFLERAQAELDRSVRHDFRLSFLMVDIDHFKDVNDKHGHLVGDVVLKELASILTNNIREVDILGRYGGEEFIVILPNTGKTGGFQVAERLRVAVGDASLKAYDETIKITISIGVASFPDDADELNQLIDSADRAMYQAKAAGRNCVKMF